VHRKVSSWFAALGASVVMLGVLSTGAYADFGVAVSGGPANPAAGAHSDLNLKLDFSGDGGTNEQNVKAVLLELPPGLVGDPNATARCSTADFTAGACPAATQVGDVSATTAVELGPIPLFTLTVPGEVYNLAPQGGEPARLGIHLTPSLLGVPLPAIDLQAAVQLRAPGDYGLDTLIDDIPDSLAGFGTHITSMSMNLYGTPPGATAPFLTNPTRCAQDTVRVTAVSYQHTGAPKAGETHFTRTGCDQLPFTPTVDVTPKQRTANQPGAVAVTLGFPAGDTGGRAQSHLESAKVVLPVGTALSPGIGADGLDGCSDAEFAASAAAAPGCSAASEIGTVKFVTPLLGVLDGTLYMGDPTADVPMRLFVYAAKGDVAIKLVGTVSPDSQTGQLTTAFTNLPQVPFTAFTLAFRGGPTAVLTAPDDCGDHQASATLEPYSAQGTSAQPVSTFATVDCVAKRFAPTLGASPSTTQAGADTHMTITVARTDADRRLDHLAVSLPPGLLGHLNSVPSCPIQDARAAICPLDTLVGIANVAAGTGAKPLSLDGPIYLTGPVDGAVAALAVVTPAKVGPLDLGTIVTIAKLAVRSSDAGIDVTTGSLPSILGGVPLAIRSLKLDLSHDHFLFNASSCAARSVHALFTADDGTTTATADVPYQATGCASLPFGRPWPRRSAGRPATPA
jgi:hypothetical protein